MENKRELVPRYTYRVSWSDEDQEFVATCAEFASLSWLAEDPGEAIAGIVRLALDVVTDLEGEGELVPEPLSMRTYSGKFLVRATPTLHARLVREAAEQHVSLNHLATEKLALGA
jgi:predicted HicB family RNase H-like nuclease